jgi:hypothetical protein
MNISKKEQIKVIVKQIKAIVFLLKLGIMKQAKI